MDPTLTFRRATSADIADMSRIRLAVRENALSNPARITPQMYEDYLDRRGRGWVAQLDGETIGFAYGAREDGSIWALFVDPRHEGQGAAQGLMKLVVAWLFSLGHERLHLGTQVDSRADRFYAAQGWMRGEMIDDCEVAYTLARGSRR